MEVSSTSMKVASVTVSAIAHGLWCGFHAVCVWLDRVAGSRGRHIDKIVPCGTLNQAPEP